MVQFRTKHYQLPDLAILFGYLVMIVGVIVTMLILTKSL